MEPVERGVLDWLEVHELQEVVAGELQGRASPDDIVLFKDFLRAFDLALAWKKRFLMVAQRWDTDVTEPVTFAEDGWAKKLRQFARTHGFRQHPNFIDFFLFSKGLYEGVPPLVVGYCYWDHWMVWKALSSGVPVLDASLFILPIHQNHGYSPESQRTHDSTTDAGSLRNYELCQNGKQLRSIQDSTHRITRDGRIRRTRFRRVLESAPVLKVRQLLAEKTFWVRNRLGLRRETVERVRGAPPTSLN